MAKFTKINADKAPQPAKQTGRLVARMREYEGYVKDVKRGDVGKLTPGANESARGLALRISRAAKRAGKSADTWVVDGALYFRVG